VLGGVTVAVVLLGVLAVLTSPVVDAVDREWVQCEVVAASPQPAGTRYRMVRVQLETTDCGDLTYRWQVTEDNVEEKAAGFPPGTYEFELGAASRVALRIPQINVNVREYRQLE